MDTRQWNQTSNRILIRSDWKSDAERRIKEAKSRGFKPLMDMKEEVDFEGRTFYVCVMENPNFKKKEKRPS